MVFPLTVKEMCSLCSHRSSCWHVPSWNAIVECWASSLSTAFCHPLVGASPQHLVLVLCAAVGLKGSARRWLHKPTGRLLCLPWPPRLQGARCCCWQHLLCPSGRQHPPPSCLTSPITLGFGVFGYIPTGFSPRAWYQLITISLTRVTKTSSIVIFQI